MRTVSVSSTNSAVVIAGFALYDTYVSINLRNSSNSPFEADVRVEVLLLKTS